MKSLPTTVISAPCTDCGGVFRLEELKVMPESEAALRAMALKKVTEKASPVDRLDYETFLCPECYKEMNNTLVV